MAEYIERKMLKSEMTEAMCGTGYQQWAIDVIDRIPTADVVEVVRCKECEHSHWEQEPCHGKTEYYCPKLKSKVDTHFYCALGKRKEGAEE